MYHIARNVKNDHFRKNKIQTDSVDDWADKVADHQNKSTEMQHEEEQDMLKLAMGKLSEEKREVILLSKYQEKKYSEIGELLGCTEGAVKVKVFRALQELKAIYGQLEKII
jgi:RNA polymerase sigma-70 factor (ECF subfamily)